jgi:type VI secretion system secreted protein VgrG
MAPATLTNGARAASSSLAPLFVDPILNFPQNGALNATVRVVGLTGTEGISQLYHYQLQLIADRAKPIAFDQFLGQRVIIRMLLPGNIRRSISGIISLLTQERSDQTHAHYRAEVVPRLWLLTKRAQSRIFQDLSAMDIVGKVLESAPGDFSWGTNTIDGGAYPLRPYCVQYRETDFNFLSRLLEEEGIYYYFQQEHDGERLVFADAPLQHPDLPHIATAKLDEVEGGNRPEDRITAWQKTQELRSGKCTLWDHSFELPRSHLEATKTPVPTVQAGSAKHRFDASLGRDLEIYDYPGDYAERFDGVNRGGGDQSAKLQGIFKDNLRTAAIRMEQEALPGLIIHGMSTCRQFQAGYQFTLEVQGPLKPSGWKADGKYLLTAVHHRVTQSLDRSGMTPASEYHNQFSCIPIDLPFRPLQRTAKPTIHGTQTAVVVGSGAEGEEIFTDKYGRVKVRFFWDRRAPNGSPHPDSCWIRVAQTWAGQRWGTFFWPRIGQEVVVAFEEGDPDRPIIIGSVYNAEMMPPYTMPEHQTRSGIKTRSSLKGTEKEFNELRFEDKRGHEEIYLHAERDLTTVVESCEVRAVGGSRTTTVHKGEKLTVDEKGRETLISKGDDFLVVEDGIRDTTVHKGDNLWVQTGDAFLWVETGDARRQVDQGHDVLRVAIGNAERQVTGGKYSVVAKEIVLVGLEKITLSVGASVISLDVKGITIFAPEIHSTAAGVHEIIGLPVKINS